MPAFSTSTFDTAIDVILSRAQKAAMDQSVGFPHYADANTGEWTRSPDGDWTGGFFVGQLWLGAAAGRSDLMALAQHWSEMLRPRLESETIFRGFIFWYGAALGAKLLADERAGELAKSGAYALAKSFNPTAGLLPLGAAAEEAENVGASETNIDGVPGGAPLLYWVSERTGDETLHAKATSHVQRHIDLLVRDDGSVVQSATIDPGTGNAVKTYTHKGVTDSSTWARAQAWAMLGLAQAMRYEPKLFLEPGRLVCDWWCDHLPNSNVAPWDFDAYKHEPEPRNDSSATAIAAAALLKMRNYDKDRAERYERTAIKMVDALVTDHLVLQGEPERPAGILGNGCYNNRIGLATHHELVWGTYCLLECLLGLRGVIDTAGL